MIIQKFSGSHGFVLIILCSLQGVVQVNRSSILVPRLYFIYVQVYRTDKIAFWDSPWHRTCAYFFSKFNSDFPRLIQYIRKFFKYNNIIICTNPSDCIRLYSTRRLLDRQESPNGINRCFFCSYVRPSVAVAVSVEFDM